MKKTLSLLLVLCLVCAVFTGCKSEKKETASDGFQFPDQEQSSLQESQAAPTAAPAMPQEPTEFVDLDEPNEPETENDSGNDYEPGYRTEDYWCSEFMGLQFHLPAGYFMADDAYYAELMQISAEVMGENGQLYTDYTKINSVYEMMAQDYMGNNVIVIAERTPWEVTTEEYIDSLAAQLVNVTGISYSITSIDVVNFAGMEFGSLEVIADYNSVTIHQRYLIQSRGERVISIVMSSVNPDTLDTIQNFFEPYN